MSNDDDDNFTLTRIDLAMLIIRGFYERARAFVIGDEEDKEDGDAALRIARYLEMNNFENLEDAAAKGFGDTSPLETKDG